MIPKAAANPDRKSRNQLQKSQSSQISFKKKTNLSLDTAEINRESAMRGEFLADDALASLDQQNKDIEIAQNIEQQADEDRTKDDIRYSQIIHHTEKQISVGNDRYSKNAGIDVSAHKKDQPRSGRGRS